MRSAAFLLLFLSSYGFSQNSIAYLRTAMPAAATELLPERDNLRIPFELVRGMIVLSAEIDAQQGHFILDTGAPMMVINDHPATDQIQASSFQQSVAVGQTTIGAFNWAGNEQYALDALVVDISHLESAFSRPLEGMIGYNALQQYELFFDYAEQIILRCSPRKNILHQTAKPLLSLPIDMYDHLPVITLQVGGKKLRFGIDTGACANLIDPSVLEDLDPALLTFLADEEVQGLDQQLTRTRALLIDELQVKERPLEAVKFLATDLSALRAASDNWLDGLLGYAFLSRLKFSINYPKQRLYIWSAD